jgi:hypothetical protein
MSDTTPSAPRSSPSAGRRVWLLPSSPFEVVVGERSGEREAKSSALKPVSGLPISGYAVPSRPAAA